MSPRASQFVSEAFERSRISGEDRLTEFLGLVLASDKEARDRFCEVVGLRAFGEASVTTQLSLLNGRRVDLELQLRDALGWHVLWIEAKVDADEQEDQLLDYRRELIERYEGRGTLVALGRPEARVLHTALELHSLQRGSDPVQLAVPLTWQQVARSFEQLGRSRAGTVRWRRGTAANPVSATQRTLGDFLQYLERKGLTMKDEPLTLIDGLVASRGRELFDKRAGAITRLLDAASERLDYSAQGSTGSWYWPGTGDFCSAQGRVWGLDPRSWPPTFDPGGEASLQLWFTTSDLEDRPQEAREQAVFLASVVLDPASPAAIASLASPEWRDALSADMAIVPKKNSIRVSKLRYLGEIISAGITLTQQAEAVAVWASSAFDELLSLSPPTPSSAG